MTCGEAEGETEPTKGRDWDAAEDEDDPRAAIELVPEAEADGYLLITTTSEGIRARRLDYDAGGHVLTVLEHAFDHVRETRGFE